MVRKRLAKAQSVKSRSFEFTLDNRLLKLGLRGNKSVMITRPVASRLPFSLSLILLGSFFFTTLASGKPHRYAGRPFEDSVYHGGPQLMPGRALCAYCDLGGEGVVYHDSDAKNYSSGSLHPADGTYLNQLHVGWVGPRVVQHGGASGADRRARLRLALYLERRWRYRVRCKW